MPKKPAKKTPPKTAGQKATGQATESRSLRTLLFRPSVLLLVAVSVSATFLLPLARQWIPDLREQPEYQLQATDIQTTPLPPWVPPDFLNQVIQQAQLPETLDILDDDLTRRVAQAFQRHPWVRRVVRVEKTFPASLQVELEFREPVAMVRVEKGLYPIDEDAVLLPPQDFSLADADQLPLIENVATLPDGPAGTRWTDPTVVGAARLAAVLKAHWRDLRLKSIWVPQADRHTSPENLIYQLITTDGSHILWGRPPGTDYPGELPAKQKIGRLKQYLADFGGFDQPNGPYEIDIRHWREISRRPLRSYQRQSARPRRLR